MPIVELLYFQMILKVQGVTGMITGNKLFKKFYEETNWYYQQTTKYKI